MKYLEERPGLVILLLVIGLFAIGIMTSEGPPPGSISVNGKYYRNSRVTP